MSTALDLQACANDVIELFGDGMKVTLRRYKSTTNVSQGNASKVVAETIIARATEGEITTRDQNGVLSRVEKFSLSGVDLDAASVTEPLDGEWTLERPGDTKEIPVVGMPKAVRPDGETTVLWEVAIQAGASQ